MPAPFDVRNLAHRLLQLSEERNTRMIVHLRSSDGQRYSIAVMERVGGDPPWAVIRLPPKAVATLLEDERSNVVVEERFTGLPPAVPSIHLNGTSGDELFRQVCDAAEAVRAADGALLKAEPHARDYYVQGERAYAEARVRHESRLARLRTVYEELQSLAEDIAEANEDRKAR